MFTEAQSADLSTQSAEKIFACFISGEEALSQHLNGRLGKRMTLACVEFQW